MYWANLLFLFFIPTAPTENYALSLHDALPIRKDNGMLAKAVGDLL